MKRMSAKFATLCSFVLSISCLPMTVQAAAVNADNASVFLSASATTEYLNINPSGEHVYVMVGYAIDDASDHVVSVDACGTALSRIAMTSESASGAHLYLYGAALESVDSLCTITSTFDTDNLQMSIFASSFNGAQSTVEVQGVGESHDGSSSALSVSASSVTSDTILFGISRDQSGDETAGTDTSLTSNPQAGYAAWISSAPYETTGAHGLVMQSSSASQYDGLVAVIGEYSE